MQGLLGGLSNVLETLRGEGVPPPACRAVVHAALRYVDAELLNALMLRRDCCSISAIKVLQVCKSIEAYPPCLLCKSLLTPACQDITSPRRACSMQVGLDMRSWVERMGTVSIGALQQLRRLICACGPLGHCSTHSSAHLPLDFTRQRVIGW